MLHAFVRGLICVLDGVALILFLLDKQYVFQALNIISLQLFSHVLDILDRVVVRRSQRIDLAPHCFLLLAYYRVNGLYIGRI